MYMGMGLVSGGQLEYDVARSDVCGKSHCMEDILYSEIVRVLHVQLGVFAIVLPLENFSCILPSHSGGSFRGYEIP